MLRTLRTRTANRLRALRAGCHSERFGNRNADWTVCIDAVSERTLVYSFGIGTDLSFDLALIARFGLTVYGFDPTPRSIAWVKSLDLPPQFHLVEYGIADFDGSATFFPPENPEHISHSMVYHKALQARALEVQVRRLSTLMHTLGHKHVDILKMDIEGAEYGVIRDILQSPVRPGQLLVEFHHRFPEIGPKATQEALTALTNAGYILFDVSQTGEEYCFVRRAR